MSAQRRLWAWWATYFVLIFAWSVITTLLGGWHAGWAAGLGVAIGVAIGREHPSHNADSGTSP